MNLRASMHLPLLLVLFSPLAASAACEPARIKGSWYLLFNWVEAEGGGSAGWDDCTVKLDARGNIKTVNCASLELGEVRPGDRADLTGLITGRIQLRKSCRIVGTIDSDGEEQNVRGFVSRDVEVMHGTLSDIGNAAITTFEGVRKK